MDRVQPSAREGRGRQFGGPLDREARGERSAVREARGEHPVPVDRQLGAQVGDDRVHEADVIGRPR